MKISLGQLSSQPQPAIRIFHIYLWLTMILLFVQGTGSLVLDLRPDLTSSIPWLLATVMNGNPPHAVLHIVWGVVGLFVLFVLRSDRIWLTLGVIFGVFYTFLGFLGIAVHNPFDLRLAWQENAFHLTVGPLMLVLAFLAWRIERNMPESEVNPPVD
jgi:hypothetical protein